LYAASGAGGSTESLSGNDEEAQQLAEFEIGPVIGYQIVNFFFPLGRSRWLPDPWFPTHSASYFHEEGAAIK
jgi:hypothetical protein